MDETGLFIDWFSVWQVQPEHIPHNSGFVVTFDGAGNKVFERCRTARLVGSHSTSCAYKSDGQTVVASGNYGRLNRRDNLFNYSPLETLELINKQLRFLELPLFHWDDKRIGDLDGESVDGVVGNIGAAPACTYRRPLYLSRVDLTKNYACGSLTAARSALRAISAKCKTRMKKGVAGDDAVWWSNTRYMLKVYIKSVEMEAHGCNTGKVYEYARDNGIIRLEVELKQRELSDLGWSDFACFLEDWNMKKVHKLFGDYEQILEAGKQINHHEFINSLPQRLRMVADNFLAGLDVKSKMKRTSFYKYRRQLLEYGIDISDERPEQIKTVVRFVEIIPLVAPDWYWEESKKQEVA